VADNLTTQSATPATVPASTVIATDDVGGVHYQLVKLAFGALDTATLVATGAGLPISDAGGSLTVDNAGTFAVQATQSGAWGVTVSGSVAVTDNAGSLTVDAPVGTPVFVRLSDGTSAITTLPVSLASVPSHPVTNAGTFAVQVSSALPAGTNNIGDVDVLSLPSLPAGTNNIGDVDVLTLPALPAGTNNIGDVDVLTLPALAAGTNLIGQTAAGLQTNRVLDGTTALTPKFASIDIAASGDTTEVALVSGKKIRVLAYRFVSAGAVSVRFKSGASTNLTGAMSTGAAGGGGGAAFNPIGHFETASGEALVMNLSAAVQVSGHLVYVEV
jgi:hypothetical protein